MVRLLTAHYLFRPEEGEATTTKTERTTPKVKRRALKGRIAGN